MTTPAKGVEARGTTYDISIGQIVEGAEARN